MTATDAAPTGTTQPLFRAAAVDRLSAPERLDIAAAIVKPASWLIIASCLLLLVAALIAGIFISVPSKVHGNGILLDAAGIKDVVATASGELRQILVHTGDRVKAGQVLASVAQPDLKQDLDNAKAELADAREQLQRTVALQESTSAQQDKFRVQQRENLKQSIQFGTERVGLLTERMRGIDDLTAKGLVVKQRLIDARNELAQASESLANSRSSLKQIEVEEDAQRTQREREKLGLELKVTSAERKLALIQERLGRVDVVTSAYNGVVGEIKRNDGEVIERGSAILSIVPDPVANPGGDPVASLVATVYVDPADGKKIHPGMAVEVLPTTVKREETGFVRGKVTYVSQVPATAEGMVRVLQNRQLAQNLANGGAPFEVRVELQADPHTKSGLAWSTSGGPDTTITSGSPTRAEIIVRSEPVLQMLVPATKPYFDAMRPTLDAILAKVGL